MRIKPKNIYNDKKQSTPVHNRTAKEKFKFMAKTFDKNTVQHIYHLIRELDLISIDEQTGEVLEPTDIELIFNQTNNQNNEQKI